MRNWKAWFKAAGIRAVRTFAQTAVASIGVAAVISEVNWAAVASASALAAILSMLTSKCPYCSGRGRVKSPMAVSVEVQRRLTSLLRKAEADKKPFEPKIVIAPQVMQRLRTEDADILAQMQKDFGTRLTFVSELHRHPESFAILDAATGNVLYTQS